MILVGYSGRLLLEPRSDVTSDCNVVSSSEHFFFFCQRRDEFVDLLELGALPAKFRPISERAQIVFFVLSGQDYVVQIKAG